MDKTILLNKLKIQVDQQIKISSEYFGNLSSVELNFKKSQAEWSIIECLDHLNSYAHFYYPKIKNKLKIEASINDCFSSDWLGKYFIKMMQTPSSSKKYSALKIHQPKSEINEIDTLKEYFLFQNELLNILKNAQNYNLNKRITTSISYFITIKLGDLLQFLVEHNNRHLQQAIRCLSYNTI